MKKKLKIFLILVSTVIVIAFGYGFFYYQRVQNYKRLVNEIEVNNVDLTSIKDGTYIGEKNVDIIKAKVRVEVKNHIIEKIDLLEYKHERGEKAKVIPTKIIEKQRIDVDVVSGATNASKVIQKAVEKAIVANPIESK